MRKTFKGVVFFTILVTIGVLISLLAFNILERKEEEKFTRNVNVNIADVEPRDSVWGKYYPKQYETQQQSIKNDHKSKYKGSVEIDELEENPRLVVLWAGYGFSKSYLQGRGHSFSIENIREDLRVGAPKEDGSNNTLPATCWTCKSPDVPRYMKAHSPEEFYEGKWSDKGSEVVNPIGCADCHDAKTMELVVTRPALIEGFEAMGRDINEATHNEMRSLVCAQCHSEYYFDKTIAKKENVAYLKFPWDNGLSMEDMERYYDSINHVDWVHKLSGAPMLKAQHPDYETFVKSTHAERGVSCSDCHMPYKVEGGVKFTDHNIGSPLASMETTCLTCHNEPKEKLINEVYERQKSVKESVTSLEESLVRAHVETSKAMELGAVDEELKEIRKNIRHAQWRWDFSVASHPASFYSPVEMERIISSGMEKIQNARIDLARLLIAKGSKEKVLYPDISTKAKAQKYIGLDMEKILEEKEEFMKTLVPKWEAEAKEREATYGTKAGEKHGVFYTK